jgi:hypothetical protein
MDHFCPPGSGSAIRMRNRIRIQQLKLMRIRIQNPVGNYFFITKYKGSRTRDFQLQIFYMNQIPPTPEHPNRTFLNFCRKIRGDIREWMFINGVNDDKRENIEVPYFFIFC